MNSNNNNDEDFGKLCSTSWNNTFDAQDCSFVTPVVKFLVGK